MENKIQHTATFQDILPFETIQIDFTGYLYSFIGIVFVAVLVKIAVERLKKSKQKILSKKEISLQKLKNLDLDSQDQKQVLYEFTLYAKEISNNQLDTKLQKILRSIEPYKYHAKNIQIEPTIKQNIKRYRDELEL